MLEGPIKGTSTHGEEFADEYPTNTQSIPVEQSTKKNSSPAKSNSSSSVCWRKIFNFSVIFFCETQFFSEKFLTCDLDFTNYNFKKIRERRKNLRKTIRRVFDEGSSIIHRQILCHV